MLIFSVFIAGIITGFALGFESGYLQAKKHMDEKLFSITHGSKT